MITKTKEHGRMNGAKVEAWCCRETRRKSKKNKQQNNKKEGWRNVTNEFVTRCSLLLGGRKGGKAMLEEEKRKNRRKDEYSVNTASVAQRVVTPRHISIVRRYGRLKINKDNAEQSGEAREGITD